MGQMNSFTKECKRTNIPAISENDDVRPLNPHTCLSKSMKGSIWLDLRIEVNTLLPPVVQPEARNLGRGDGDGDGDKG